MKGELTYNIEVLNARLIQINKQIAEILQKEAADVQVSGRKEDIPSNGCDDSLVSSQRIQ